MSEAAVLKQRLIENLSSTGDANSTTVIYLVFKTIQSNPRISVNRLNTLLGEEYFLTAQTINSAVAGLVSRSMFNAVSRWRNPKRDILDTQVTARETLPPEFQNWLSDAEQTFPELLIFQAPVYVYRQQANA